MNDRQLDRLFRTAPREITPPYDLWPAIVRATRGARRAAGLTPPALVAAGLLIFLAGFGVGTTLSRGGPVHTSAESDTPFLAAVRVQETGTAYVSAIMLLQRHLAEATSDGGAVSQGREVALATLEAARRAAEGTP